MLVRWIRGADAKSSPAFRLATAQGFHPSSQGLVRWDRQVEAFAQTVGVQPQQSSLAADNRPAGRTRQQRGVVLDASSDATATRPSEAALNTCDETQRDAQSSATWIRQCEDGRADSRCAVGGPLDGLQISGFDPDDGNVSVDVQSQDPTGRRVPVGECDADLVAAHVVRICQYLTRAQHHARSDAPTLPDADDRVADLLGHVLDLFLDSVECTHLSPPLLVVTCKLLLTQSVSILPDTVCL